MADANMCLEAARKAFPNDENLRVAYMLGFNEGFDKAEQKPISIVTPRYAPPVLDGNVVKETSSVGTYPEPSCQTCTNDKGCVTCVGKELWEGEQKQELPAEFDLEKEIETAWDKINCSVINFGDFADIAEHFYELGKVSQPKPRSRFEQPICTITQKECRNLRIVKDQYGVKYGHCMKADCYLWDVEECSDEKPIKKGGKR